jgi:hypothetical protein
MPFGRFAYKNIYSPAILFQILYRFKVPNLQTFNHLYHFSFFVLFHLLLFPFQRAEKMTIKDESVFPDEPYLPLLLILELFRWVEK